MSNNWTLIENPNLLLWEWNNGNCCYQKGRQKQENVNVETERHSIGSLALNDIIGPVCAFKLAGENVCANNHITSEATTWTTRKQKQQKWIRNEIPIGTWWFTSRGQWKQQWDSSWHAFAICQAKIEMPNIAIQLLLWSRKLFIDWRQQQQCKNKQTNTDTHQHMPASRMATSETMKTILSLLLALKNELITLSPLST